MLASKKANANAEVEAMTTKLKTLQQETKTLHSQPLNVDLMDLVTSEEEQVAARKQEASEKRKFLVNEKDKLKIQRRIQSKFHRSEHYMSCYTLESPKLI